MLTESERSVVREVLIRGPISRRDLGDRVELAAPSLTRLLKPFLASGMLVEVEEPGERTVGRPVRLLDVAVGWGRFAGAKITGDRIHLVITDGRARPLSAVEEQLASPDPGVVADQLASLLSRCAGEVDAVGVSVGGVVDRGIVADGIFLGWQGVDFGTMLAERLGVPVVVENDVVALAQMQRWFGVGRSESGFALITIGVGVGYGLVVGGRVVSTREAGAGLAAHLRLVEDGPSCDRGHRGCAESLLTSRSFEARYAALAGTQLDHAEIIGAAAGGDEAARQVTGESAVALGRFVALAANLSLQSTVVLAGDGVGLWAIEAERIRDVIAAERDPRADPIVVVVDDSGFAAWARGAAVVAIRDALGRLRGASEMA